MIKKYCGVFTALITPFKDGKIDYSSLDKLLKFQIDSGVNGFVVNGTTAESPTLSDDEKAKLLQHVQSFVSKQVPVIMGTGSNSTEKTVKDSILAEKLGADSVLVVVPYYNKPPQRGLYLHYKTIAENINIPVILYNVPGRTITSLEVDTIFELSKIKNIIGIKEATGNIDFEKQIIQKSKKDFLLLSGDDGTYPAFLDAGGHGVISVTSHVFPKEMQRWQQEPSSRDSIIKYKKLIELMFTEANPIPVKMALHLMGIISSPELRLPLVEHESKYIDVLKMELSNLELL